MGKMLNLIDILLTTGRQLVLMGRFTEALQPLTKLSAFRNLPEEALVELQSLLAEIALQQKNFKSARRHLTAAIAMRPLHAEYHYLMALAIDEDIDADRKRAEMYYTRAIELDGLSVYYVDFGAYLVSIGKSKEGLKMVRKAYAIGIADAEIVGKAADILRREGHVEEATAKVRAALFHNHASTDFRLLWQEHQYALIYAKQQKPRATDQEPTILQFTPAATQGKFVELGEKTIRIDRAEPLSKPRGDLPVPFRRPPKKG
jgi:tetratricopeptide (TPR) repeat protein